ncbi:MAG: MATE family efflux transporter [Pseudomonadota bacterium]
MEHKSDAIAVAPGGREIRGLLALGLPLIGSRVAQFAVGLTDTVMMGWYSIDGLAALTIGATVFFVLFLVGTGLTTAVTPMVASALAEGDTRQARRVTRMGLWLAVIYGALALPVMLAGTPILLLLRQEPVVAELGGAYLAIAGLGLIPALIMATLTSFLAAVEKTRAVLLVTIGVALLNVVVNYALIFGNLGMPELGILGAAVASATINLAGAIALMLYAVRAAPEYGLLQNIHRPDWPAFGQVFRLGLPIGLTWLAEVGLFGMAGVMIGWVGKVELAAHGIALQITSATFMVHLGLSQAATVRAGSAWGRRDRDALRRIAKAGFILSMGFVALTIAVFLTVPELLVGLFVDPAAPERGVVVAMGATLLACAALFQLVDAGQVMALGVLRGTQDTRVPMIIAAISYWGVGTPAAYVLGFALGFGAPGVWLGLVAGLTVAAVLLNRRLWRGLAERS